MEIVIGSQKEEKNKKPDEWQLKDWAETLLRAEEIRNSPEKMKLIRPMLQKKMKAIRSIADLREMAKEKEMEMEAEDDDGEAE